MAIIGEIKTSETVTINYVPAPTPWNATSKVLHIILTRVYYLWGIIASLFIWIVSSGAYAAETDIHYAYPDQMVIVSRTDEEGKFDQPINRIVEELFKQASLNWKSHEYPAARMFQNLDEGTSNFSILVNSPRLDACCLVGKIPVASSELRVYHKNNVARVSSINSLQDENVITLRGYSYGPFKEVIADPDINIKAHPAGTHASAFAMLNEGRANYLLDYNHPSTVVLQNHPIQDIQYETLGKVDLYLVLHRSYPNAQQVLDEFEAIIQGMDIEGMLSLPIDLH